MTEEATPTGGSMSFVSGPQTARQASRSSDWHIANMVGGGKAREKAAYVTIGGKKRIVAFEWLDYADATSGQDYNWIRIDQDSKLPLVPYLAGGKLMYDQLMLVHNAQENAATPTVIYRNIPRGERPKYMYGATVNAAGQVIESATDTGMPLKYQQYVSRRTGVSNAIVMHNAVSNWAVMDAVNSIHVLDNRDRRTLTWFALMENWLTALAFVGNPVNDTIDAKFWDMQRITFPDFYDNVHDSDVTSVSQIREMRTGFRFYYLQNQESTGKIRIRTSTDIRCASNYCKWWARHLLYTHPTHLLEHVQGHHHANPNF